MKEYERGNANRNTHREITERSLCSSAATTRYPLLR